MTHIRWDEWDLIEEALAHYRFTVDDEDRSFDATDHHLDWLLKKVAAIREQHARDTAELQDRFANKDRDRQALIDEIAKEL